MEVDRLEAVVMRVKRRVDAVEVRLDALEEAVLEMAAVLRELGEAMTPDKEKEQSEAHGS
jgi:hypothetical protein